MIRALILAAGLGTRLRPLTDDWPKCLMPIGKRPLLDYWLQTLHAVEISQVLINSHFHADKVKEFLGRKIFASWVKLTHEEELLGTAGTIRANIDFFQGQTTLLVHGDNWCQCDFGAFIKFHLDQRPKHCLITMMTFDSDSPQSCGVVEIDNQGVVVAFHEKVANPPGRRANAAVYLLQPQVIEWLINHSEVTDFSTEVLPQYIGRIATWHNSDVHRDIGTLAALGAAQKDSLPPNYWPEDEWQKHFQSSFVYEKIQTNLKALE